MSEIYLVFVFGICAAGIQTTYENDGYEQIFEQLDVVHLDDLYYIGMFQAWFIMTALVLSTDAFTRIRKLKKRKD